MTIMENTYVPPCAKKPEVYLDERLQCPPARTEVSGAEWEQLNEQLAAAHRNCAGCPFLVECLYRAVVEVDVFGYAACTTEEDRRRIRRKLGIEIQPSAGTFPLPGTGTGHIDHEAIVTLRRTFPHDTRTQLAQRMGCSISTIKRHLRRARAEQPSAPPAKRRVPTVDEVLDCFDELESSRLA